MKKEFPRCVFYITLLVLLLGLSGIISIAVCGKFALVWKQSIRLVCGVLLMWAAAMIPFEKFKRCVPYLAAAALAVLVVLLRYGVKLNGMRGWFKVAGLSIQPSEPAKAVFLAGLSVLLSWKRVRELPDILKIAVSGIYTMFWLGVLILQPDMGTATVYAASFIAVLYLSKVKLRYILTLFAVGAGAAVCFVITHPYAMRRITGFLHPELDPLGKNWHLNQLLRAVSRGAWTGVKSSNAHWSRSYLPFAYNDSAFATMCETTGALGAWLTPAAFMAIFYLLCREADKRELPDAQKLYVRGAAFMVVFQSFLHISVNLGIVPVTGITLLFVSYGGSSMISGCLLLGLAFSALKSDNNNIQQQ
ncbi:MAG: FtsW/RodA/SpoVE family cell cycle protein [Lentisphaeria bacterium]|nr:FtsW/RodA/SpoVE family cell cycle protein [Lentisphaeria bacterium]